MKVDFIIGNTDSLFLWIKSLDSDMLEDIIGDYSEDTRELIIENGCEILMSTEGITELPLNSNIEKTIYDFLVLELEIEYLCRKRVLIDNNKKQRGLTFRTLLNTPQHYNVSMDNLKRLDRITNEVELIYF